MRRLSNKKLVLITAGALVLGASLTILILSLLPGHLPEGHPAELVGEWTSEYRGGEMMLVLREDGSFSQELSAFDTLPPKTSAGTWNVTGDRLILTPFIVVRDTNGGWADRYDSVDHELISVRKTVFGGIVMNTIEDLRFRRASR